jgi:hypothetical protein
MSQKCYRKTLCLLLTLASFAAIASAQNVVVTTTGTCSNANDGTIVLELDSFLLNDYPLPYAAEWENITDGEYGTFYFTSLSHTIPDLTAGDYELVIALDGQCEIHLEATVESLTAPELSITPICICPNGYGALSVEVTGGSGNYGYYWDGPSPINPLEQNLQVAEQGTYSVTVIDNDTGCEATAEATVEECNFDISNFTVTTTNVCTDPNSGSIAIQIPPESGQAPYWFFWFKEDEPYNQTIHVSNDGYDIAENLSAGEYCVNILSNNGCSAESCNLVVDELPISPYLKSVEVRADLGAGYGPLLYLGKWQSNGNCISYSGHSYPFNGNAETIGLKIRAFANEPLSELYIELPGLDPSTALGNSSYGGFIWEFPFPPGVLFGSSTPEHQILFDGKDMSNNPLLDLRAMSNNLTSCVEIPELQDDCAWSQAPIQGEDDVHIFEVGCMILSITVPPPPISGVAVLKILGASPPYKISWTGPNTNYFTTTFLTTVYLPANSAGDYILKVIDLCGSENQCFRVNW